MRSRKRTLALLHSGLEDIARTGAWLAAARGDAGIVLGTRLAVLAPLPRLGLIVVDEEHDASFKQQEGLRYSARDAAVYRAKLAGCPVILGTATPSLETWHNWTLGPLRAPRAAGARLAGRAAAGGAHRRHARRSRRSRALRKTLLAAIGERLAQRRAKPDLHQPARLRAGARLRSLRLDRGLRALHRAHGAARRRPRSCAATTAAREAAIPRACPTCGNVDLKPMGRGTQRVEETLAARFPQARIVRIDRDSARRRGELTRTLEGIRRGEGDILVGTQLLAKGHDFPALTLVGVLNADSALVSTDYRARRAPVRGAGAGRRPRRAARAAGRSADPDALSAPSAVRGARAPRLRAASPSRSSPSASAAGFPPFVFEAALRAEAPKLEQAMRIPARGRGARCEPPDEVQRLRPGAAHPHAPRRTSSARSS